MTNYNQFCWVQVRTGVLSSSLFSFPKPHICKVLNTKKAILWDFWNVHWFQKGQKINCAGEIDEDLQELPWLKDSEVKSMTTSNLFGQSAQTQFYS